MFIKLTTTDGEKFKVNVNHIMILDQSYDNTRIELTTKIIRVKETVEQIEDLIKAL